MPVIKNYFALGNAGILVKGFIPSSSNQACPRRIYLRACGLQEPVDSRALVTFAVGSALEEVFSKNNPTWEMSYRLPEMLKPFDMFPDFGVGLEADAVKKDDTGKIVAITELKSVSSTKIHKRVFAEGHYKLDNLIQLCSYLTYLGVERGFLMYTSVLYHSYTFNKEKITAKAGDKKVFAVTISEKGKFLVDKNETSVTVDSISRFGTYIACVLDGQVPFNQVLTPIDPVENEKVSCFYCPLREACEKADSWEDFERRAKTDCGFIEKLPEQPAVEVESD